MTNQQSNAANAKGHKESQKKKQKLQKKKSQLIRVCKIWLSFFSSWPALLKNVYGCRIMHATYIPNKQLLFINLFFLYNLLIAIIVNSLRAKAQVFLRAGNIWLQHVRYLSNILFFLLKEKKKARNTTSLTSTRSYQSCKKPYIPLTLVDRYLWQQPSFSYSYNPLPSSLARFAVLPLP